MNGSEIMHRTLAAITIVLAFAFASLADSNAVMAQVEGLELREGTGIPAEVRNIYRKGADYLAKSQKDEGHWGSKGGGHGDESAGVAALATMAFLSIGEDPNFGNIGMTIIPAPDTSITTGNNNTVTVPLGKFRTTLIPVPDASVSLFRYDNNSGTGHVLESSA